MDADRRFPWCRLVCEIEPESRSVLSNAISYRIQEKALGGLKLSTQRQLDRIAEGGSNANFQGPRKIVKRISFIRFR